jgi:hypothetical protein
MPKRIIDAELDRQIDAIRKNPNHPWHSKFDWDDESAAHKFRLSQAQDLMDKYARHLSEEASISVVSPSSPRSATNPIKGRG